MATAVVVLNCGSSSVKFALVNPESGERRVTGMAERVGSAEASLTLKVDGEKRGVELPDPGYRAVVAAIVEAVVGFADAHNIDVTAVGHRIAHGGPHFTASALLDDAALAAIRDAIPLAPLHNPAHLLGIDAARAALPDIPHVGVFDTAFHQTMPPEAYRYAVPSEWFTEHAVRRYGFHGTSHGFVAGQAAQMLGRPLEELRLVTCHLGNGCSLAAIVHGASVDTTMGLTPLEGLVMGTRCGDIDPGMFQYMADATGADIHRLTAQLTSEAGVLGLSGGLSNDMRTIEEAAAAGNTDAQLALDVFHHRLATLIGAMAVSAGGLDALVFTGGIGENGDDTRADVVRRLAVFGLTLDAEVNATTRRGVGGVISGPDSAAPVLVVPTDEELVIARDAARLASAGGVA